MLKQFSEKTFLLSLRPKYKKYFWIPANFVGPVWKLADFKKKILAYKSAQIEKLVKPSMKISVEIKYWCEVLSEIAYLNELRKSYFTRAAVAIRPIFDKLAKQNNLGSWEEINLLTSKEILDLVRGKNNYQKVLVQQRQFNLFAFANVSEKKIEFLSTTEVKKFLQSNQLKSEGIKEVGGIVAWRGVARGKVKILLSPADFPKLKTGEILIDKMTSTDFIPVMKRAGAFVTDEGALTCHAAIVAREYNKPCIIGTKIATKVLKDGDLVEVDAEKGIVRKIHPVK